MKVGNKVVVHEPVSNEAWGDLDTVTDNVIIPQTELNFDPEMYDTGFELIDAVVSVQTH